MVDRWDRRLATGRDMLWSPTICAALLVGMPWLDVFRPGCGTSRAIDIRGSSPARLVGTLVLGLRAHGVRDRRRCQSCSGSMPCRRRTALRAGDHCLTGHEAQNGVEWDVGPASTALRIVGCWQAVWVMVGMARDATGYEALQLYCYAAVGRRPSRHLRLRGASR